MYKKAFNAIDINSPLLQSLQLLRLFAAFVQRLFVTFLRYTQYKIAYKCTLTET